MELKFGELREYISKADRVAVCVNETMNYETYRFIDHVPDKFDDMYVLGFGMSELEFSIDSAAASELRGRNINGRMFYAKCIEVTVSQKPRSEVFGELEKSIETVHIKR